MIKIIVFIVGYLCVAGMTFMDLHADGCRPKWVVWFWSLLWVFSPIFMVLILLGLFPDGADIRNTTAKGKE